MTADPIGLVEDGSLNGNYGTDKYNRFPRMGVTVHDVLVNKEDQTEVLPCFIMDGAMIVDAAAELISYNKFVVEGLGLDELAEALAARGCLVVYAPGEVCQLEGGEARALRVLVRGVEEFSGDPAELVGEYIEVEGLGVGQVTAFKRAMNRFFYDSKHVVKISSGESKNKLEMLSTSSNNNVNALGAKKSQHETRTLNQAPR